MTPKTKIHDELRINADFGPGTRNPVLISDGVLRLISEEDVGALFLAFCNFDQWDTRHDPDGAHDMGMIRFDDHEICFKIDPKGDAYSLTFFLLDEI